jgi:AraC-like DNA-binding protein
MRASFEKILPPEHSSFKIARWEQKAFGAPWHFHPELELTWIITSHGMRLVGDSVEPFAAGDLVFLGPDLPHCWLNSTEWAAGTADAHSLVLQFREDFLGPDFARLPELRELGDLYRRARRGLCYTGAARDELTARLQALLETPPGLARLADLLTLLVRLAHHAPQARPLSSESFLPTLHGADGARIDRVIRFLQAHYTRPVTLAEAAAQAHLSPSAFSRYFRAKIGKSFVRFLNELRVSHATRLLIEGDLPITEICYTCGFENLSNFNRRFRQFRGKSPRDLRKATGG